MKSMPRSAISAVTTSANDQSGTARRIACFQPLDAFLRLAHRQQHLFEGDAMLGILKLLAHQPVPVRLGPRPFARTLRGLPIAD
jgi:hypothetical protein